MVDVQTHLLEHDLSQPLSAGYWGQNFPQAACGLDDPRTCFGIDQWRQLVLDGSETSVAVLSAVPIVADVSSADGAADFIARAEAEIAGREALRGDADALFKS